MSLINYFQDTWVNRTLCLKNGPMRIRCRYLLSFSQAKLFGWGGMTKPVLVNCVFVLFNVANVKDKDILLLQSAGLCWLDHTKSKPSKNIWGNCLVHWVMMTKRSRVPSNDKYVSGLGFGGMIGSHLDGNIYRCYGPKHFVIMNPRYLIPVLAWLSQIPMLPQEEALDVAPWTYSNLCVSSISYL